MITIECAVRKKHACTALAWPLRFQPQHLTPPDAVTVHVCKPPAAITATFVNTSADGVFRLVFVPSPSCTHQTQPHFSLSVPTAASTRNMHGAHSTCLAIEILTPAPHTA